jgi:heat shock protein HslJ
MRNILLLLIVLSSCKPSNKIGELVGVPKERPLENTYWVLVEINGQPIVRDNSKKLFIQLNADTKSMIGFAGCNRLSGEYTLSGKKLSFRTISTRMFCENEMKIEDEFIQAVNKINKFTISEHELFLMQEKNILLKFQAETETKN